MHQGDQDGEKGLCETNLVDEVTQYEFVAAVEGISERFLVPALEGSPTSLLAITPELPSFWLIFGWASVPSLTCVYSD